MGTVQYMSALDRANEVRCARARQKQRIRNGELSPAEVILDPASCDERWPIAQVLMAQRRWGIRRTQQLLSRLMISETRPLGALTQRQRYLLADALGYQVNR